MDLDLYDIDGFDDPKELLGDDFYNYDKFCDWLDIADEEDDGGLQSLIDAKDVFDDYEYSHHSKIMQVKINQVKNKYNMKAIIDADSLIFSSCYNVANLYEATEKFNRALDSIYKDLSEFCVISEYIICSGGDNKLRRAINPAYKMNRTQEKPTYLSDLHKEVKNSYESNYVDGYETDDVVASIWKQECDLNGEDSVIIVANDKDYKQFPCWYFDTYYKRRTLDKIEPFEADYNFYTQMIVGDVADNIKYFRGKGKAYAKKRFQGIHTTYGLFRSVYCLFLEEFGDEAKDKFKECYSLLRLRTDIFKNK